MMLSKQNELILDICAFVLHLPLVALLILGGGLLMAPEFGADSAEEVAQGVIFTLFAITILVFDIRLITKRRFHSYLAIFGVTHMAMLMWCIMISAYDMGGLYAAYLALGIPLLILKQGTNKPSKTPPEQAAPEGYPTSRAESRVG